MVEQPTHLRDYADRLESEAGSPYTDPTDAELARFWREAIAGLITDSQDGGEGSDTVEPVEG